MVRKIDSAVCSRSMRYSFSLFPSLPTIPPCVQHTILIFYLPPLVVSCDVSAKSVCQSVSLFDVGLSCGSSS